MAVRALVLSVMLVACIVPGVSCAPDSGWAIAIHGGAGTIPRDMDPARAKAYERALAAALQIGTGMLADGRSSLDVVEAVVRHMEDDSLFNAGKGAVFTHDGTNELDAAIMDGATLNCGSISGVTTVKNPVSLARLVMEKSRHVFFVGAGAERFADEVGVERVDPSYFFTQTRYDQWRNVLQREAEASEDKKGTVGCVARDRAGHLAAATSTGGLTDKRFGRVGDVPVIGAGTYADDRTCAVSCTGTGEVFIRNTVARTVAAMMEFRGDRLNPAAADVILGRLETGDGGLIAVSHTGEIALVFNTTGMYRAAADSKGRLTIAIWGEE